LHPSNTNMCQAAYEESARLVLKATGRREALRPVRLGPLK